MDNSFRKILGEPESENPWMRCCIKTSMKHGCWWIRIIKDIRKTGFRRERLDSEEKLVVLISQIPEERLWKSCIMTKNILPLQFQFSCCTIAQMKHFKNIKRWFLILFFCEKIQDFDFFLFIWNKNRFCSPGVSYGTEFVYISSNDTLSFDRAIAKISEWLFEEHLGFREACEGVCSSHCSSGFVCCAPAGAGTAGGKPRAEELPRIG